MDAIAALFAKGTGDPYLFTRDHSLTLTPPLPASVAGAGLGRDVITTKKLFYRFHKSELPATAGAFNVIV